MKRVPCLEHCGIKTIVNGPISYTPDGSPLVGPAWGVRNVWLNEGHSFGVTAAGGAGWQLAEWIVEGEPGIDMLAVDPRRFGAYTGKRYTVAQERGDLSQRLHDPLSRRGARGCAAREDERGLREAGRDGRRLGTALRLGARQLVRAAGRAAEGRLELPAQQLFRARRQRVPADARAAWA